MNKALDWMVFAKEDLSMARIALREGIVNQACFHAQQGVEKAFKAYLRFQRRSVPKTHSLTELLEICKVTDKSFEKFTGASLRLDRYYIPTRYPDALPGIAPEGMPTPEEAGEAVKILEEIADWIDQKIR